MTRTYRQISVALLIALISVVNGFAEDPAYADGYRLWLNYDRISDAVKRQAYANAAQFIAVKTDSPILKSAADELQMGLQGLLGKSVPVIGSVGSRTGGIVLSVNPADAAGQSLNKEGYRIESKGGNLIVSGKSDVGVLYGAFALLRQMQTLQSIQGISLISNPKVQFRMLNHWDNVDGSIERGYAGSSLWKWYELPERIDPRYRDYARANASIGINGTVVNNVNASARFMTSEYIEKVAALANVFRPYGIRLYLSVYFAAPKTLGGLKTSDPLDPQVRQWWADKVKAIYQAIPDFGGFLVKANSEGEPGPQDYGRTHADGANMLAEALKPYDGVVIWRAFVYKADPKADRFKAAYEEFVPLDGQFDKKVIVQVKNGPIDFQPREPFSPLFGNMPKTPLGMEFQLTQEYLGFATHLVYEAPLFKECLETDTYVKGKGSTVAKVVDGSLHGYSMSLMAGVANTGSNLNWTGHPMAQANWYAFGRLAWDHTVSSEAIAREWVAMTLTHEPQATKRIVNLMGKSRDIYVNYNTPMGLSRPWTGVHFAPEPWQARSPRPDWTAVYYHRADSMGIGFDRTAMGSKALEQYRPEVQQQWNNPETCPIPYLLWFHHVPWTKKLSTGRTLWDELCTHFYTGADSVRWMQQEWAQVKTAVNPETYANVAARLETQQKEAVWWRDAWVLYLQSISKQPIPAPFKQPARTLDEVKQSVNVYLLR
ncbi:MULTISPECIES: alpha-glucuronidase family glycosyl hydrolase [unclassified Spirosoma]|uniref:alpha-glucuronidase family glycosyl hydrolase n=1 Tax=unclassified Spirosoma TaxID=2621999 RepID=UPI000AD3CDE9|nr:MULTISPECIES: alpha-glucuronidase family glycosyl hydrolase [unclassified Spirosoma]MBN8821914.1 alpha-glucuronidase [Spirosoma sp.]